jgi:archaellum component FlaC
MIPEFETKINSQIAEINNQVNSIKPEIKKIEKQVGDMLETVEFLSK